MRVYKHNLGGHVCHFRTNSSDEKMISTWQPNKVGVYTMSYGREEVDKKKKVDRTPQRKPILVLLTTVLKNEKSAPISNCLAMYMHNQSCF